MQSLGLFIYVFIGYFICVHGVVLDYTNNTALWNNANALSASSSYPAGSSYPTSLCWNNTVMYTQVAKILNQNWSTYGGLYFNLYSNGEGSSLFLIIDSDTNGDSGYDYFYYPLSLDWIGWKNFNLPLKKFSTSRQPTGWGVVQKMYFAATGYNMVNSNRTQVCFNGFELGGSPSTASFLTTDFSYGLIPSYSHQSIPIIISNPTETPNSYVVSYSPLPSGISVLFSSTPTGATSTTLSVTYTTGSPQNVTIYATFRSTNAVGSSVAVTFNLALLGSPTQYLSSFIAFLKVVTSTPLPTGLTRPYLFLDPSMKAAMSGNGFKASQAATQISVATSRLSADRTVYIEWGSWQGFFYCDNGAPLVYNPNNNTAFYCVSESKWYTGEPYTKSWYTVKHGQVISFMQDLAIGYYLTGNTTYADAAISILEQYSAFYPALPYRGLYEGDSISAGRLLSQTLDESTITPTIANSFDLLAPRMTATQLALVEHNLLRAMAATIKRYDARDSNWQTWHNAALAVIGYAVNDASLVDYAVNGTHGFYYQLNNDISDDGFWWENSIAYHFYTLQAMQWLLAVCTRRGNDLSNVAVPRLDGRGVKTIETMYISPIQILEPLRFGWGTPSINDDHSTDSYITTFMSQYVFANWQWGPAGVTPTVNKQAYSWVLNQGNIPTIPYLLWGAPISAGSYLPGSITLAATGLTILSVNASKDWMLLKHGPHGGYHGHYDKLELLFDHAYTTLLEDYGTVEYTQALHYNYFKRSLSHNTILVDGVSQGEASGTTLFFGTSLPDFLVMSANSTELNTGSQICAQRTVVLLPNLDGTGRSFAIDLMEPFKTNTSAPSHDYFNVYHSSGNFQVTQGPAMNNYTIPFVSKDPSWGYFTSAKSVDVPSGAPLRYSWTIPGESVQDGFESIDGWSPYAIFATSLSLSTTFVKEGKYSFKWINQATGTQFTKINQLTDWSSSAYVTWWMYNVEVTNSTLVLVLNSENSTSTGPDYYSYKIILNWIGWKQFNISRTGFSISRSPVGWAKIDSIIWSSTWSDPHPSALSQVYLDAFKVFATDGSLLPDSATSGLEILADANAGARQFITATAPDQPATSYHPVTVSKISGESLFAHLLISPPSQTGVPVSFSSLLTEPDYSRLSFTYGNIAGRVYLMRGDSSQKTSTRSGVRLELTRGTGTVVSGYRLSFISPVSVTDNWIGLNGSQATGKIESWALSARTCNLTVSTYDTAAAVQCKFNISAASYTAFGFINGNTIPSSSLIKSLDTFPTHYIATISYAVPLGTQAVSFSITGDLPASTTSFSTSGISPSTIGVATTSAPAATTSQTTDESAASLATTGVSLLVILFLCL